MIFDIIVLAVVLISALHAFWRGLIREVLTIFGAIGGVLAALTFGDDLRPLMDGWLGVGTGDKATKLFDVIPMNLVSVTLAYAAVFVLVFGVLSFISHLIAEQVRAVGLGAVDRTLGVVFGLLRGLLIVGIFYLPIHIMMDEKTRDEWFSKSQTQPLVQGVAATLESLMADNALFAKIKKPDASAKPETTPLVDALRSGTQAPDDTASPAGDKANTDGGYAPKDRTLLDTLIDKGVEAGVKQLSPNTP
jgi:membrane protein required for colicin V production